MTTRFDGDMTPVNSSAIEAVGYDPARRAMCVRFKGGALQLHHDVAAQQHTALISAESIGHHFAQHIRNAFASTKLWPWRK
jgi:hypothetical protein